VSRSKVDVVVTVTLPDGAKLVRTGVAAASRITIMP
jgi:hypothetical protein